MQTWQEIEARRKDVGISRAELARRAGISESTVFKGLQHNTRPSRVVHAQIDLILTLEERLQRREPA